jgi:hypothetical protein
MLSVMLLFITLIIWRGLRAESFYKLIAEEQLVSGSGAGNINSDNKKNDKIC